MGELSIPSLQERGYLSQKTALIGVGIRNERIDYMDNSVVQAQAQSPKLAKPSPSCQSRHQGFTGPRAWALIFGSLRLQLQALGVYTDKFSVIFIVEGLKKIFNHAISLISVNINELFTKQL